MNTLRLYHRVVPNLRSVIVLRYGHTVVLTCVKLNLKLRLNYLLKHVWR